MSLSVLHCNHHGQASAILGLPRADAPLVTADPEGKRRSKLWQISTNLHCSIIGTCLTAGELRQFFVKLRAADAASASDHALHSRGVRMAEQHDLAGKLLNKTLDKRHESAVKRFAKATSTVQVRDLWRQALAQGDIPGAYWAVLTHPATDRPLIQEVFGEVHMLSHLVGMSNRMDIARLRELERELALRDEKITRQQDRLQAATGTQARLQRHVESLETELVSRLSTAPAGASSAPDAAMTSALHQRLEAEKAHGLALATRLRDAEQKLRNAEQRAAELRAANAALEQEIGLLEDALDPGTGEARENPAPRLDGVTLLYVGGRPKLVEQLRALTAQRGGALIAHDGGIEDNPALLPGLISQADAALFPVDCISHRAAGQVKKLCRDAHKPFMPLRSASLASFAAALATHGESVHGQPLHTQPLHGRPTHAHAVAAE